MDEFMTIDQFSDYEISRITSDIRRRGTEAIKKHYLSSSGNKRIELWTGEKHNLSVAELMYATFFGPVPFGKKVFVKNGVDRMSFGENDLETLTPAEVQNRLILKRRTLMDRNWRPHPSFQNYLCNENGEIFSLISDGLLSGSQRPDGYFDLTVDKHKIAYHRFVWEACHNESITEGFDIDHINNDTADNRPCNLQKLTRKEHNEKTNRCSETRKIMAALRSSKAIVRFRMFDEDEMGEEESFGSLSIAQQETGLNRTAIKSHIGQIWCGYLWQYKRVETIEGEVWKDFMKNFRVSNKGRIDRDGIVSRGILRRGEYFTHSNELEPRRHHVKKIICRIFNGDPPPGKSQVRHFDRDSTNNAADNLTWSDSQDCADNLSNVKRIVLFDKNSREVLHGESDGIDFKSARDVAKFMDLKDSSNLSKICRGMSNSRQKWRGRTVDVAFREDVDISEHDGHSRIISDRRIVKVDGRFKGNKK